MFIKDDDCALFCFLPCKSFWLQSWGTNFPCYAVAAFVISNLINILGGFWSLAGSLWVDPQNAESFSLNHNKMPFFVASVFFCFLPSLICSFYLLLLCHFIFMKLCVCIYILFSWPGCHCLLYFLSHFIWFFCYTVLLWLCVVLVILPFPAVGFSRFAVVQLQKALYSELWTMVKSKTIQKW